MSDILLWLAALIPTVAGLWTAGASLVGHNRAQKRLADVTKAVARYRLDSSLEAMDPNRVPVAEPILHDWLERNGYLTAEMSAEVAALQFVRQVPMQSGQVRDQWILLSASTVGVVLLAASLLV